MILVAGAATSSRWSIVERLRAGGHPVRVMTGIDHPGSAFRALAGVSAVYVGGRRLSPARVGREFLDAAYQAGVERIVVKSSGGIDYSSSMQTDEVAAGFLDLEQRIRASGLAWTFLRVEIASADALRWAFDVPGQLRAGHVVRGPYAGAAGSPIHPEDFAAVAVAALIDDQHSRRAYSLTGPASLTHAEQIRLIGQVRSRTVVYQEIDPEAARSRMHRDAPSDLLLNTWARYVGRPAPISDAVATLTGRRPRTPWQWAIDYPADQPAGLRKSRSAC